MKVKIGNFINWIGPYQIADWFKKPLGKDRAHQLGEWLSNTWVNDFCQWLFDKRSRTVKVKLHSYDTWNADLTLAYVILPVLVEFRKDLHGSALVEDVDVPIWLHSTLKPGETEWDTDGHVHDRWKYVLDEMIWSFNEKVNGDDSQFYDHSECDKTLGLMESARKIKIDHVGLEKYHKRMQNGFRLFGKYFQNLWD